MILQIETSFYPYIVAILLVVGAVIVVSLIYKRGVNSTIDKKGWNFKSKSSSLSDANIEDSPKSQIYQPSKKQNKAKIKRSKGALVDQTFTNTREKKMNKNDSENKEQK